jgi:hypothetical protein
MTVMETNFFVTQGFVEAYAQKRRIVMGFNAVQTPSVASLAENVITGNIVSLEFVKKFLPMICLT